MSGVHERKRSISSQRFFQLAIEIHADVMALMANENVVPKRYRFLVGVPTAETARNALYNINRADEFFPNCAFNVIERRRYYKLAIADFEQLYMDFQAMEKMPQLRATAKSFEDVTVKIDEEIALLDGVYKSTNIRGLKGRTYDDLVQEAEAELERRTSLRDAKLAEEAMEDV
jgi:hypothetical protein